MFSLDIGEIVQHNGSNQVRIHRDSRVVCLLVTDKARGKGGGSKKVSVL